MRTKLKCFCMVMFTILLFAFKTNAQQVRYPQTLSRAEVSAKGNTAVTYTYKVFEAPNKMYGYDILRNDKYIFHQPASLVLPNNSLALAKKEHAEKAAVLSIQKIKKS